MIKMKQTDFLKEHCEFNNPYDCYVLLAVSRKKDTPEITNSQEIVFREVIKNEKDIARKFLKVKTMCENYQDEDGKKHPFYIYISLNPRDSLRATFQLMYKINLWSEEVMRGVDRSMFFKKVYGHFYSTLMHKSAKSRHVKYFMFDIDDKSCLNKVIEELDKVTDIKAVQETKNGYHIKINPFDSREFLESFKEFPIELKRDANFFVDYVKQ